MSAYFHVPAQIQFIFDLTASQQTIKSKGIMAFHVLIVVTKFAVPSDSH